MPQNLLEPTWMELDSDDHFDCPERGRRTQHEIRAQFDALRISSTPMHPMSGQAQDFLLICFVSRCEPGGEAYFLQLSTRRVHTSPNACFPAAWNGASR